MDVGSLLAGAFTGLIVAVATFWFSRRAERERWQREDGIRREEFEREARSRWSTERRELYGRLLRRIEDLHDAALNVHTKVELA